jgi:thiol:disulfide interchange protein DsbD
VTLATMMLIALAWRSLVNHARESTPVEANSTDPRIAVRQEKVVHGVRWGLSYEAALEQAEAENTPVLVYFTAVNDPFRIQFETTVLAEPEVAALLAEFIPVQLYQDYVPIGSLSMPHQTQLARTNVAIRVNTTGSTAVASLMILTPQGDFVTKRDGYQNSRDLAAFLRRALAQARHQASRKTP